MSLGIDHLSFRYKGGDREVLKDISLKIEGSGITVLLGLNGCGKTTLIKLLAGLEKPSKGAITYNEENLKNIGVKRRSTIFSYVAQNTASNHDIPVRLYLLYGTSNTLSTAARPGKEEEKRVKEAAARFKITHLLDKELSQISGGELQIVRIVCAIIQNTPYVLLDEPTSALDMANQNLVLKTLRDIARNENKTIILSTHNPNHALFLESNVILLHGGNILDQGDAKGIVTKEKLKEVYGEGICLSKDLDYQEISFR